MMKNNLYRTKASTLYAFLQLILGFVILLLSMYKIIPAENANFVEILATALIVSGVKDSGHWMFGEFENQLHTQESIEKCSECGKIK